MQRRKDEHERRNAIAEEEAKKALLLNPLNPITQQNNDYEGEPRGAAESKITTGDEAKARVAAGGDSGDDVQPAVPTVTITREKTSNIMMPPILKDFLGSLENCRQ